MFLQILTLLGSLAMFLYGLSLMSGGLQKMAGNRLRSFMAKMTSNYFTCILTGIVVTAMVPNKGEEKETQCLKYIGVGNIATGDLALNSAKLEVVEFETLCRRDRGYIRAAINAENQTAFEEADKLL